MIVTGHKQTTHLLDVRLTRLVTTLFVLRLAEDGADMEGHHRSMSEVSEVQHAKKVLRGSRQCLQPDPEVASSTFGQFITSGTDFCRSAVYMDGLDTFGAGNGSASRHACGWLPCQIYVLLLLLARWALLGSFFRSRPPSSSINLPGCRHYNVWCGASYCRLVGRDAVFLDTLGRPFVAVSGLAILFLVRDIE